MQWTEADGSFTSRIEKQTTRDHNVRVLGPGDRRVAVNVHIQYRGSDRVPDGTLFDA
jgi:hypothetical protein